MTYGMSFTPNDLGKAINMSGEWAQLILIEIVNASASGGTRTYRQNVSSGGIPVGAKVFGVYTDTNAESTYGKITSIDRGITWGSFRKTFNNDARIAIFADYSNVKSFAGAYGVLATNRGGISNILYSERSLYVLAERETINAGVQKSVKLSGSSFLRPDSVVFVQDDGNVFTRVGSTIYRTEAGTFTNTKINNGMGRINPPKSGVVRAVSFVPYSPGLKPNYGMALYTRSGRLGYRTEYTPLILGGLLDIPYLANHSWKDRNEQAIRSFKSLGGGVAPANAMIFSPSYGYAGTKSNVVIGPRYTGGVAYTAYNERNGYQHNASFDLGWGLDGSRRLVVDAVINSRLSSGEFGFWLYATSWPKSTTNQVIPYVNSTDYF